jgi:hypothetical protein
MSANLSMDVLRLIAVRAISGRTWAGDRVFDSPATPTDIRTETDRQPFIAIYVDEADVDASMTRSIHTPCTARLVIEVGVASPHRFTEGEAPSADVPGGGPGVSMLNATDHGLELQIGLISQQAIDALTSTKEDSPWAAMFLGLVTSQVEKVEIRRGGPINQQPSLKTPPRFASRITVLHLGILGQPPRGADLAQYPWWETFFEAAAVDPKLANVAQLIRLHIVNPTGVLPDWRLAQKLMTLSASGAHALGIAPINAPDEPPPGLEEAPGLDTITFDGNDTFNPWAGIPL